MFQRIADHWLSC